MPISLRLAVPLFLLFVTTVIATYTLTVRTREALALLETAQLEQVTRLSHRLQGTLEYLLRKGDQGRAQDELIGVTADPNIGVALVVDAKNQVLVSLHRADIKLPLAKVVPTFAADQQGLRRMQRVRTTRVPEIYLAADGNSVEALTPIFLAPYADALNPGSQGVLYLKRDIRLLKMRERYREEHEVMQFTALMAALAVLTWWLFHFAVTRRAAQVVKTTQRFTAGDDTARIRATGRDEIAQIAHALDSMAERVVDNTSQLLDREKRLEAIFRYTPEPIIISRIDNGKIIDANQAFFDITGLSRAQALDRTGAELGFIQVGERQAYIDTLRRERAVVDQPFQIRLGDGLVHDLLISSVIIELDGVNCILSTAHDVTERKRMEALLFAEKERAVVTLASIGDGVITAGPDGVVQFLNPVAERLTGWRLSDAVGQPLNTVFRIIDEASRQPILDIVARCLKAERPFALSPNTLLLNRENQEVAVEDSAAPIRDAAGLVLGVVLVFHDVSHARKMALQLSWQASHDALTGLINRREFETRLTQVIHRARDGREKHVVLYLDLDQFKLVNDTCGHVAGDELLKQLASVIQLHMRESDTFARLGGDEFGILLAFCPQAQAQRIADEVRETVKKFRFVWQDKSFDIGVSIGLVNIDETTPDLQTVLTQADVACYAAKDAGRNRVHVYEASDAALARRQGEMEWVGRITRAFEEKRFILYRQAIVPLAAASASPGLKGRPNQIHYEILVRMYDEKRAALILPGAFLPAAERYGIMPSFDRWVVRNLFRLLARQAGQGADPHLGEALYSINLSGATVGDELFLDFVQDRLHEYSVAPHVVCFEITETAAIANLPKAMYFITEMKKIGCRFSLDDFGSGVSSFAYLKNLPVDFLKIDGSFVRDMANDAVSFAMVDAIHHIGHVMGILTIAEWVESEAILLRLRDIGVDYAQGFHLGLPQPMPQSDYT